MRTHQLAITGLGIVSAIGQGKADFSTALFEGRHNFTHMKRPGRLSHGESGDVKFLGAEINELSLPAHLNPRTVRTASLSAQAAAATTHEAWQEAGLNALDPARIGLVIGGSNVQQRALVQTYDTYAERSEYIRPSYASSFFDTDITGLCSELLGIRGFAYTLGAASASGQVALIHAAQAVLCGQVDACIAVGALMDLSHWECHALRSVGAMGSDCYAQDPASACRPYDRLRDGFIYGESCAAIVVERMSCASERGAPCYAEIAGWGVRSDANRSTNPSYEGELNTIQSALSHAGWRPEDIDYVNPHGSGSLIGDETELRAIRDAGLSHARINATKALTGHGLTAAGAVEIVASLLQMKAGKLHPTRNLRDPIDPHLKWVGETAEVHTVNHCLSLSIGFGGINSAVCLRNTALS
jgi:malonyl-ACP decarboxylase